MELADDKLILGLAPFRRGAPNRFLSAGERAGEGRASDPAGGQIVAHFVAPGQIVAHFVAPGQFFGLAVAVGLSAYPGTAIAASRIVALSWPSAAWAGLVAAHPGFAEATLRTVGSCEERSHAAIQAATHGASRLDRHAAKRRLATTEGKSMFRAPASPGTSRRSAAAPGLARRLTAGAKDAA